jgi:D-alanyl-D-alanine carboxypeptidase (penicillin-binding protein 5/6)
MRSWIIALAIVLISASIAEPASHRARRQAAAKSDDEAGEAKAPPAIPLSDIHAYGGKSAPFALDARAAMLVDGRAGTVLYSFNEHQRIQPASLAKIMTFYIALGALRTGKIAPDTQVTISEHAWRLSMDQTVSKMFLEVGQKVAVRDLLYGMMVSSGNDAAMALAEYLGGSSEGFVAMMNEQCERLGLKDTRFGSPDGLPVPDQYTTAADMVKLAHIVVNKYPEALTYTSTKEYTFHKIVQHNWNTLLFYDSRVNGLKTGHVAEAGFHLVATADSNGLRLISAVMGARNAERRRVETEKLLDWAFRSFVAVRPDWHKAIPDTMRVYEGSADSVAIAPARSPATTVARGEENQVRLSARIDSKYLVAPISKGQAVGELTIMRGDTPLATIPIQTQAAVARGGFFHNLADKLRRML